MSVDIHFKIEQGSGVRTDDNKRFDSDAHLSFQATVSDPAIENDYVVRSYFPVGALHPWIPGLNASRVSVKRVAPYLFDIDVDYVGRGKPGESPFDEPPQIKFGFAVSDEAIDMDDDGKPIVMVTGEQLDPPLRETQYDLMIRIARNLRWVDPDVMSDYAGAVNSDGFFGLPPGTCCITEPPTADSAEWEDMTYYKATIGFTVRRGRGGVSDDKAWYRRVLAQGFYILEKDDQGNKVPVKYKDKEGRETKCLHDIKTGERIPDGPIPGVSDPDKAQWYEWKTKKTRPFSALRVL